MNILQQSQKRSAFLFVSLSLLLSTAILSSTTSAQVTRDEMGQQLQERRQNAVTLEQRKAAADRAKSLFDAGASHKKKIPQAVQSVNAVALLPAAGTTPHYFGPYSNWANSAMPQLDANGNVIAGTGIRKFMDSLPGLGSAKANNLGQYIPVAVPDTTKYPGSDYYEIELREYAQRMHTDLRPTTIRGYVQTNTTDPTVSTPHYLGPIIKARKDVPVRVKFTNKLPTGAGGNLFLPVDTTVMGAGMGPYGMSPPVGDMDYTQNRSVIHLHGGLTPWISDGTPHQWITPAGEVTSYPKGVSVYNVPDMPDPGDGSMTFFYSNQQSARLMFYHDHTFGITRLNVYAGEAAGYLLTDTTEQQLITSGILPADQVLLIIQDKTFIPDAATLMQTDPTWPFAVDPAKSDFWYPHVYMTNQNPYDLQGVNPFGRWDYGPWFWPPYSMITHPEVANPYYDPANAPWEPPTIPGVPDVSMTMEAYHDTPVINGTAYPYITVQPKAYRFRILNAANDRFWNLLLLQADPTITTGNGVGKEVKMLPADNNTVWPAGWPTVDARAGGLPDPALLGPQMIQIGTEGGFLPSPVVWPNTPIGYDRDTRSITVGNVKEHNLFLGSAERADVIIDFSAFAGKTLILYNDAPAPVPAIDPRLDYYTGDPDLTSVGGAPTTLPGFGPNTRTIMQIRVAQGTPQPFNKSALDAAFASTATAQGVFAKSQDPIIVPQAEYNSAYNATFPADTTAYARIQATSLTYKPIGSATSMTTAFQPKSIQELFEMQYGRMSGYLGLELPFTNGTNQTTIWYDYMDPPTESIDDSITPLPPSPTDGTQLWKVTHNGVDTHAVHFHLFNVQLVNRVDWAGVVKPPEPNELGWKETVRMNPLEDAIVALRPVAPKMPFGLPDSVRPLDPTMPVGATGWFRNVAPDGTPVTVTNDLTNFGWEYMWHCHILSHEEMDMMRPIVFNVGRQLSPAPVLSFLPRTVATVFLSWTDPTPLNAPSTLGNPANEIGFRIERAAVSNGQVGAYTAIGSALANGTTFNDTTANINGTYSYRVIAYNAAGNSPSAPVTVPALGSAVIPGAPTSVHAYGGNGLAVISFAPPASDGGSPIISYTVTASPGGRTATGASSPVTVTGLTNGTAYTFTVRATNVVGTGPASGPSNSVTPSIAPPKPSNLAAVSNAVPLQVNLTWSDNSANETGFTIRRALDSGFTNSLATFTTAANATSFADKTVIAGTTYYYRIRAFNGSGSSSYSNTASVITPNPGATVPGAPVIGTATAGNALAIVNFSPPASNGGSPVLSYTATSSPGGITATGAASPITVPGLTNGTAYTFTVRATNSIGTGPASAASNSVTPSAGGLLAPTNLVQTAITRTSVSMSWTDNSTNEGGFYVEKSTGGPTGPWNRKANLPPNTTSYTNTGLSPNVNYWYRVQAYLGATVTPYTNVLAVTTPP